MRKVAAVPGLLLLAAVIATPWTVQLARAQDVSLRLLTKDGRSEYRIGEPIALQLVFSSNSSQYILDTSFRYPQAHGQEDEFVVSPAGGSGNPFEDYVRALSRGQMLFDVGGLRGFGRLGEKPVTLDLILNKYVRFTKPGHYFLSIVDHRVSLVRSSWNEPTQAVELTSNPLSLTISAPDPDWQTQQLASALRTLQKGPGTDTNACEIIAALGTLESELSMADSLLGRDDNQPCGFSYELIGAHHRKLVLRHMQEKLRNPLASVTPQFVDTMASLTALESDGDGFFYQRQYEARNQIDDQLLGLLDEKVGPARIAAISTLVNQTVFDPARAASQQGVNVLRSAVDVFDRLSSNAQSTLLSARWNDVAGPAMVPVLRRCAESDDAVGCGRLQGDLLLARLNELSPADAREVILADMQKENPRFMVTALALLPDKELPEMDAVFQERLHSENGNLDATAALIERYATAAVSAAVQTFLHDKGLGQLGGQIEPSLISYLLRVEPDAGERELRAALAVRDGTGWYKGLLRDVAQRVPSPKIQDIATDALSDPDHEVVQSAVEALALVGDRNAKAVLFERLDLWRSKWAGRERELFWTEEAPIADDRFLGDQLIQSIGRGAGWLLGEEDQKRLVRSAVSESQKQQAEQFVQQARNKPVPMLIQNTAFPHLQLTVAQYSYENIEQLKRKLSQFPVGAHFLLESMPETTETRNAAKEIASFCTQRGMRLEIRKTD